MIVKTFNTWNMMMMINPSPKDSYITINDLNTVKKMNMAQINNYQNQR